MLRFTKNICISLSLLIASSTYAALSKSPQEQSQINLYEFPALNAKVLESLSPNVRLVPIYHQKDWIKVGDARNGNVGWINQDQYNKAINTYLEPKVRTVFVNTEYNEKGKPVVNVVAYENGNKLSDKDAQQLYEQIKKQEHRATSYINSSFAEMNRFMEAEIQHMHHWLDSWRENFFGLEGVSIKQPDGALSKEHPEKQVLNK